MAAALRFSLRLLRRDLASGEIRLLWLALLVAVGAVTAVAFFTDRLRLGIEAQANALLASDLAIEAAYPIAPALRQEAERLGLATAEFSAFRSMVRHGEQLTMAEVKAVGPGYPLRGQLELASQPYAPGAPVRGLPPPGQVWVDPALPAALGATMGAEIELGELKVRLAQTIAVEPDRGGEMFSIAPRLLMNLADLPATRLVQLGSRVQYRLLVAGRPETVEAYRAWLGPRLTAGEHLVSARDARPELRSALERADAFLSLAALCAVLLAGLTIGIAARRFSARHLDGAAVMRCLGATGGFLLAVYSLEMLWLALAGGLAGALLGLAAEEVLTALLGQLASGLELPMPSFLPVLQGLATAVVALAGFALPPLLRLHRVPPARVLRRDRGEIGALEISTVPLALIALGLLAPWQAGGFKLTALVLAGTLGCLFVLGGLGFLLVRLLAALRGRLGVAWRYGLANIARRAGGSVAQIAGLGVGMMVILVLTFVRADLFTAWRGSLPAGAHNQFLINIQPAEREGLRAFFAAEGHQEAAFSPMVRGRYSRRNGQAIHPEGFQEPRARRLAEHHINLSFAARLPPENRLVAGRFWPPAGPSGPEFSVERGIAETLGLHLGDRIGFSVADQEVEGTLTSLREVQWDTFHVNFFVIGNPALLAAQPTTYITSFYLRPEERPFVARLSRQFPGVTVVDVDALITHIRTLMDRANTAVEFVFLFSLAAGLLILAAAISATHDDRLMEGAILKTLGASRRTLMAGLAAEFAALGAVAGGVAALGATALGAVLAHFVFHVPYVLNPLIFALGPSAGCLLVLVAGLFGVRRVFREPPALVLRQS
jgi:putative ABC transport system permease protein